MPNIVDLYVAMKNDDRLQKNWEANQPRIDRAFEAPLIARTPREVATAALLAIKLKFEPAAKSFLAFSIGTPTAKYATSLKGAGTRLLNVIGSSNSDGAAQAASVHSLEFYRCRSEASPLLRLPWSKAALEELARSEAEEIINPALRPTSGIKRSGTCIAHLASLLLETTCNLTDRALRLRLRSKEFPGLGPERADAVGVFAFRRPWPIVDEYLWTLLTEHKIISVAEASVKEYNQRRAIFEPHWQTLRSAVADDPDELAATLYLWADEAAKFGYCYDLKA